MININGKRICDKEVGSPQAGWHGCNRKAVITLQSRSRPLDWCAKHKAYGERYIAAGGKISH